MTIAGNGVAGYADGQGLKASFNYPWGIDTDPNDNSIYIADYGNHKIRKITSQGVLVTCISTMAPYKPSVPVAIDALIQRLRVCMVNIC